MEYSPILIDGKDTLYICDLNTSGFDNKRAFSLNSENIKEALKPIVKLGDYIKNGMESLSPDEAEITMNLSVAIENDTFIFGIVKSSAQAEISVKYVWKKNA